MQGGGFQNRRDYAIISVFKDTGAFGQCQYGTAFVDAAGPALLIGSSGAGPWRLREIHAVCPPAAPPSRG